MSHVCHHQAMPVFRFLLRFSLHFRRLFHTIFTRDVIRFSRCRRHAAHAAEMLSPDAESDARRSFRRPATIYFMFLHLAVITPMSSHERVFSRYGATLATPMRLVCRLISQVALADFLLLRCLVADFADFLEACGSLSRRHHLILLPPNTPHTSRSAYQRR